jgi:subtilase family protein/uncharacterized protein DUF4129
MGIRKHREGRAVLFGLAFFLLFALPLAEPATMVRPQPPGTPGLHPGTRFAWDADGDRLDDRLSHADERAVRLLLAYDPSAGPPDLATIPGVRTLASLDVVPVLWLEAPGTLAAGLARLPGVRYVEWDAPLVPTADGALAAKARGDPVRAYSGAWHLSPGERPRAVGLNGAGVTIGVLEGGIDRDHVSLDDFDGNAPIHGPKVQAVLHGWYRYLWQTGEDPIYLSQGPAAPTTPADLCDVRPPPCPSEGGVVEDLDALTGAGLPEGTSLPPLPPRTHATAMAGLAAGTGAPDALVGSFAPEPVAADPGSAPGAALVDVEAYAPVGPHEFGLGVGAAVSGVDLVHEYNRRYPTHPIDVLLVPLTPESGAVPPVSSADAQDTLAAALDALATFHPTDNPVPALPVVSVGAGHVGPDGSPVLVGPATARHALVVGPADGRVNVCRGDDTPLRNADRASAAQQSGGLLKPDLDAPGANLSAPLAASHELFAYVSGSSAAAAVAAGAAGLVHADLALEFGRRPLPAEVWARLVATAEPRTAHPGWDAAWGFGLLDAARAVNASTELEGKVHARILLDATPTEAFLGLPMELTGRVIVEDWRAEELVAERGPDNTCRPTAAGPDRALPLTYHNGEPLPGLLVRLGLDAPPDGTTPPVAAGVTGADGRFRLEGRLPASVPLGTHTAWVQLPGLDNSTERDGVLAAGWDFQLAVRDTAVVDVDACHPFHPPVCDPTHPIVDVTGAGELRTARLHLHTLAGLLISGASLEVNWTGGPVPAGTAVALDEAGNGFVDYDPNGTAGAHSLTVRFAGTDVIAPNATTVTVNVRRPTLLTLRVDPGDDAAVEDWAEPRAVTFSGNLTDALDGAGLANRSVRLFVVSPTQVEVANASTDAAGAYRIAVSNRNLPPGSHLYRAVFEGETFASATTSPSLSLLIMRRLALVLDPATATRGENVTLRGRLLHAEGGWAGATLEGEWRGSRLLRASTTTGSDGGFELPIPVPLNEKEGPVDVRVRYAGGDGTPALEVNATVLVRARPRLEIDGGSALRGSNATVVGRLLDERGVGLVNRTVRVTWGGRLAGTPRTDVAGRFAADVAVSATHPLGPVVVRARFEGAGPLLPAEAAGAMGVEALGRFELDDLRLESDGLQVSGRLVDEHGIGLPASGNVTIALDPPDREGERSIDVPTALDLRRARRPVLRLDHAYDLGDGPDPSDSARVEASPDDGTTWYSLPPTGGYPAPGAPGGAPSWTGTSLGWAPVDLDVSTLAGQTVLLRWSVSGTTNATRIPWMVDEVDLMDADGSSLHHEGFDALPFEPLPQQDAPSPNWTAAAPNGTAWVIGTRARDPASGVDATHAAMLEGSRLDAAALVSPPLQVPSAARDLRFWQRLDLPPGVEATVQASPDEGRSWIAVPGRDGEPARFRGRAAGLVRDEFDLAPYTGGLVRLRFTMGANDSGEQAAWQLARLAVLERYPAERTLLQANASRLASWPRVVTGDEAAIHVETPRRSLRTPGPAAEFFTLRVDDREVPTTVAALERGAFHVKVTLPRPGLEEVPYAVRYGGDPSRIAPAHLAGVAARMIRPDFRLVAAYNSGDGRDYLLAGEANTVQGKLVDDRAAPLGGALVRVELDGRDLGTATTTPNGTFVFTFDLDPDEALGNRTIHLVHAGDVDRRLAPANRSMETTVRGRGRLDVEWQVSSDGNALLVRGRLLGPDGRAVADAPLEIHVAGEDVTALTRPDGRFASEFAAGGGNASVHIAVVYPGDAETAPTAFAADLIVEPRTPMPVWPWLVAAAVAAAWILAWWLLRRRTPKPSTAPESPAYDLDMSDPARRAIVEAFQAALEVLGRPGHAPPRGATAREILRGVPEGVAANAAREILRLFERARYGPRPPRESDVAAARRALARLRMATQGAPA